MQFGGLFGGGAATEEMPKGWKKVKSQSRPGEFSYLNEKTGQRYDRLPPSLMRGRQGGDFFDDEKDTTAKAFWMLDLGAGDSGKKESAVDKVRGFWADKT